VLKAVKKIRPRREKTGKTSSAATLQEALSLDVNILSEEEGGGRKGMY
jgi:hypothetical protein